MTIAGSPAKHLLAIETTCDETAAAVITDDLQVLSAVVASQEELHARYAGVVPEIAARAHVEVLDLLIAQAMAEAKCDFATLDGIAGCMCV